MRFKDQCNYISVEVEIYTRILKGSKASFTRDI